MNNSLTDFRQLLLERIYLEPEHFEQAARISQQVTGEAHQWQTYLNGLALFGFERWLQERMTDILIDRENCSLWQPQTANVLEVVCNLKVGEFNGCLIATESLLSEAIVVPKATVDLPEFVAHFYIVIEVLEEQAEAIVRGFLRYDRIIEHLGSSDLTTADDWNYPFPWEWFDSEPNHLLVNLRYLQPSDIPLQVTSAEIATSSLRETEREALLLRLRSPEQKLWQSLTWKQGAAFIADFTFQSLLYQWQTSPRKDALLAIRLQEVLTLLTQKAINTAFWLQGKLDELAQSMGLFTRTASLLRSGNNNKLEQAIASLRNAGLEIPLDVNPIYQNLALDDLTLQLCSVIWMLESRGRWSLLLILGTQLGHFLPNGVKLQISNLKGILVEATSDEDLLLYATIEGNWGEKFVVTINGTEGTPLILSPYTFEPL